MSACRARRPRRSEPKLSNAARRSACQCRRDAGWPGKRGAHRALAARFRRSHHVPRSWPFARGGSARVSRPPGRRPSSSCPMRQHSCHSAAACSAAGVPADGAGWRAERPRARRVAAAGCRGARSPRARTPPCWHTHACLWPNARLPLTGAVAIAAQVAGVRARLATAERSRARPRGAPGRQCKAVTTTRSTSLWSLEWQKVTRPSIVAPALVRTRPSGRGWAGWSHGRSAPRHSARGARRGGPVSQSA